MNAKSLLLRMRPVQAVVVPRFLQLRFSLASHHAFQYWDWEPQATCQATSAPTSNMATCARPVGVKTILGV